MVPGTASEVLPAPALVLLLSRSAHRLRLPAGRRLCDHAGVGAYSADQWSDFALGVAGAAAALTGLLFVAVSLNLEQILSYRYLPGRAATTLGALGVLLLVSLFMLVPGQGRSWLGWEILVIALSLSAAVVRANRRSVHEPDDPLRWSLTPLVVLLVPGLLLVVGGVSLIVGAGGGLYWVMAGTAAGFAAALANAWVLLVEVKR
jgi:modulator of FtsH protease